MYYESQLYHHGIEGQKWGVKHGPPYPIGSGVRTARKNKIDKTSKTDNTEDSSKSKKGLTDKQKKAIKIGVAAAATALAVYGSYKLYKSGKLDGFIKKGKDATSNIISFEDGKNSLEQKASSFTLKKLNTREDFSTLLKNVNPNYSSGKVEWRHNCTSCSLSTFFRSIGYDATAIGMREGTNLGSLIDKCFKNYDMIDASPVKFGKSMQDASDMLIKRYGNNASGVVSVGWKNGGGHAFNWFIKDGKVTFADGQVGKYGTILSRYWSLINMNANVTIARLDNADIVWDEVAKFVTNR